MKRLLLMKGKQTSQVKEFSAVFCAWKVQDSGLIERASQVALMVKILFANAGDIRDQGSIPGWGRSPGGGNGLHSSILAWRIPWKEEPDRSQPLGLQRVG